MFEVVRRMLPNQIDDRHFSPAGIMQIGETVAQARAEMQQSARRFLGQPRVPIGGSGDDTLEEAQNAAHLRDLIERGHEVDFRSAWIGEASVDAAGEQRAYQAFSAVHATFHSRKSVAFDFSFEE